MLELRILTPEDRFLSAVEFNYDELKSQLKTNLEKYKDLTFTEETMKEGKKTRASLNTLKTALDTKRKEIKKQCLKPYEDFEIRINELVGMVDEPILNIDNQVKKYEEALKEAKKQEIINYFNEVNPFGELIKINHSQFWNEKWLNLTAKIEDVKKDIEQKIEHIKAGLETIDINFDSEFKPQIRDMFIQTFDLTKALNENKRLMEQKKAREEYEKKQEEAKKMEETKKMEFDKKGAIIDSKMHGIIKDEYANKEDKAESFLQKEPQNQEIIIDNVEIIKKWKAFSVEVSKDEFIKIRQFLIDNNINYKFD